MARACVKCGSSDLYIRWMKADAGRAAPGCNCNVCRRECTNPEEHLHVLCRCCGYAWDEETAEAAREKEESR